MFHGSIVAIVTPFKKGKVDEKTFGELIDFHLRSGTHGIVPCGTTGESATLSHEEHKRVVELAVKMAGGRIPVIAGTGSNSTEEAIAFTRHAKAAGAAGALLITPYYNKPTQEGLYQHYKAVAKAVDLPLVLYNIPGRTGVNMLPATVARLMEFDNIIGIKEGTGSLQQISDLVQLCGERLVILSGDDFTALPTMAVGGKGVISVTANIAPADMAQMIEAAARGDYGRARKLHDQLYPLHQVMFVETNPIPVKAALALMGKCADEVRLPLWHMSDENLKKLKAALKRYGLLKKI
ncbi:MAG: 4-hydroxy-tetrahydrodipicolinate synthase [Candidatus Manganitrophus sp.]|nr:4-hydroxy-tetrahydrodipicolinate synthase [Candidatus Manganitrophus sp.]MDC4223148.1 4-hydroxy-tetrahydrodipicolinate synthase [Candidatus Manganitrophus sp.]WDT69440.1 MAG: 4-hydroxy-tetrahydrodipicolinate synthase [Candidatus Manganitrophus sp.]WDT78969.1 MAG: 4-hydroxy-tetrahydrodipicolinate synthase [Candidatus Manganitrophus sp.]